MIDLHVHSIYSDGEYTPNELLEMCHKRGITTIAITDHNSMEGSKRALETNPYQDVSVISGIELSGVAPVKGGNLHILGYGIDLYNKEINDVTEAIMSDNIMRLKSLISLLKRHYNFTFKEIDVERIYNSIGNIGRPDIARLCLEYGYVSSVEEAFKKYLNPVDDKIAKRKVELTAEDCIKYIQKAGGIATLAHPIELKQDLPNLEEYIKYLMSLGLGAVEVYQSKHPEEYSKQLLKIVNEYGLLYSVGSDYHGPIITPDIDLGYVTEKKMGFNDATILERLRGKR